MKKNCCLILFTAMLLMIFQAGCTPATQNTPTTIATNPPTQAPVIPSPTTPANPNAISRTIFLDPAAAEDADSLLLSSYVYDCLTRLDGNGTPQPALAARWTVSDDQLDYVVSLRTDVSFHSGAAFTSDTVLANFNRWFDPEDPLRGSATYASWKQAFLGFKGEQAADGTPLSPFDGIEKVDQHTVLIHLNRPMPELLQILAAPAFSMLNPEVIKNGAAGTSAETVDGTGAYFISTWNEDGLVMTPNAGYWGGAPASELNFPWK